MKQRSIRYSNRPSPHKIEALTSFYSLQAPKLLSFKNIRYLCFASLCDLCVSAVKFLISIADFMLTEISQNRRLQQFQIFFLRHFDTTEGSQVIGHPLRIK